MKLKIFHLGISLEISQTKTWWLSLISGCKIKKFIFLARKLLNFETKYKQLFSLGLKAQAHSFEGLKRRINLPEPYYFKRLEWPLSLSGWGAFPGVRVDTFYFQLVGLFFRLVYDFWWLENRYWYRSNVVYNIIQYYLFLRSCEEISPCWFYSVLRCYNDSVSIASSLR